MQQEACTRLSRLSYEIRTDRLFSCLSSRTAVAPLERLKIVLQVQGNEKVYTGVWQVRKRPF